MRLGGKSSAKRDRAATPLRYGAGNLTPRQRHEVAVAERNARFLLARANDLLDLILLEESRLEPRVERAEVRRRSARVRLRVVEAHGGSICVESEEGSGTTFTVELPLGPGSR